ncbi:putative kolobok1-1 nv [Trichonephila clavipes]|nr:putative kolobok1-1 nv [Trichonephila clavipes]
MQTPPYLPCPPHSLLSPPQPYLHLHHHYAELSFLYYLCQCNFTGSSSKMEIVGAFRIFLRSEKNCRLQYTQYYGDGDSKAFMSVKDTYGLNSVTKFECIGHVQKRVGSRLRKLKTIIKGLSGKGKLTDNFIDRLQNYYGITVRSNVGNLTAMQQNVIAALYYCASSGMKPMHGQCPIGKESWFYFQRGVANGTKCSTKYAGLSNDVLNKIKPVYLELCDKQILSKCFHGRMQNANECFNGIVWQRVPKEVFVSLKTIKFGSHDAIIHFNEGLNGV